MSRIDVIKKIVDSQPNDPFPRYGLAMEYKNAGPGRGGARDLQRARGQWPEYVAAYLMHGNLLASMHRLGEARAIYEKGIAAARKKGDSHTLGELESALQNLPSDDD